MIQRDIQQSLRLNVHKKKKIVILYGSRQVGKTTLLKRFAKDSKLSYVWVNGDQAIYQQYLSVRSLQKIIELVGDKKLLIIDEAQNIPDIGVNLKLIYDELPELRVIVTGSSALDLANRIQESLAGRTVTMHLFPISLGEMIHDTSIVEVRAELKQYLTFGMYPEILTTVGEKDKRELLQEILDSYLYKDVLMISNIRNSDKIFKLLQLLAFQIGSLVSVHELSKNLQLNHETVNNYIDLLEKGFIIKRLSGLSRNPRKEISKMDKIYFTDVGIRNALINNYTSPEIRGDIGALWENFMVIERMKFLSNEKIASNNYFWKRYSGAEIDFVEERDGKLYGTELKWKKKRKSAPLSWSTDYKESEYKLINQENFLEFIK